MTHVTSHHAYVPNSSINSKIHIMFSNKFHPGDDNAKLEGVKKIRQLLSIEKNPPIASVIDCGVVSSLIVHCFLPTAFISL